MRTIPVCKPQIGEKEKEYVKDCMESGWISSHGKYGPLFQKAFAEKVNCKYAIGVMNGTAALHLCLEALGIGLGDEVIVPSFTMIATANAVSYSGAKPVFVDCQHNGNINYWTIKDHITPKTKAIICVHIYGHPVQMDPIMNLAREKNIKVIEDCAEAHGAVYNGRMVGSIGDISAFSFYANKIIQTGEGGMVCTNNDTLADICYGLKDHCFGKEDRFLHRGIGFNYRMTNIQAAIGLGQVERFEELVERKREIAFKYNERLKDVYEIELPTEERGCKNVHWVYAIRARWRDDLVKHLAEKGIETRNFFTPMHLQPMYETKGNFVISEMLSRHGLYLPSYHDITDEEIDYVCAKVKEFYV